MYLAFYLEDLGKFEEALSEVEHMLQPERKNVFPEFSFLIEDRAYYDTSNFLNEFKERLTRRMSEHVIDNNSFDFFQ